MPSHSETLLPLITISKEELGYEMIMPFVWIENCYSDSWTKQKWSGPSLRALKPRLCHDDSCRASGSWKDWTKHSDSGSHGSDEACKQGAEADERR